MTFQLVPPHNHQRNIAEKAIQTFKGHLISILCGTDKDFPLHLWCLLLSQAEHKLNMLQRAQVTLNVSAYAYLWGQHDFNANSFAPLGCKVEAHIKPSVCERWAAHTASEYSSEMLGNTIDVTRSTSLTLVSIHASVKLCSSSTNT
jgi:hypothetical protein